MASLYALGLNHHTAPLAIRERVVFHVERMRDALTEIKRELAREAAILSTCNRTELYVAGEEPTAVAQWLARYHRFEPEGLQPYLDTPPRARGGRAARPPCPRARAGRGCGPCSASPRASIPWCWASRRSSAS